MGPTIGEVTANRGVAPIYIEAHPIAALLNDDGKVIARADITGIEPEKWKQDETTEQVGTFTFDQVPADSYTLAFGLLTDKKDESPAIAMAVRNRTDDRWHPLAAVAITE